MDMNAELINRIQLLQNDLRELKRQIGLPPKEVLTYQEAMDLLDCSRNTLDRLRKSGQLKVYLLRGRLYVKYSELLKMLEEGQAEEAA